MKRFYWENPFAFEAEVELVQIEGSMCKISPIIFHPDEGGQPPDRGTIGDAKIIKIQAKDSDAIITLDRPLPSGKYPAKIETAHRVSQSRRHTAQHIISGIAETEMGLATTGVKIGSNCTIDFDKKVEWEQILKLEQLSNEAIMNNIPVLTEYGTLTNRGRFNENLSEKDTSELRVVAIEGIDRSACCGTHVPMTGMVGSIRITNLEASRQGSRITFVAGLDAVGFGAGESTILRELRKTASCSNEELKDSYLKIVNLNSAQSKEIVSLWEKVIPLELENAKQIESRFGKISILQTSAPSKLVSKIGSMMTAKSGLNSIVFSSNPCQLAIGSPTGQAKEILEALTNSAGAKGGGNPNAVNGSCSADITLEQINKALV